MTGPGWSLITRREIGPIETLPTTTGKTSTPPGMPEALGKLVQINFFCDAAHAQDLLNRRSQTGILIFVNGSPIKWYSKRQNAVEVLWVRVHCPKDCWRNDRGPLVQVEDDGDCARWTSKPV